MLRHACSATFQQQWMTRMMRRKEDDDDKNNSKYCALFCLISAYCIILNLACTVFSQILWQILPCHHHCKASVCQQHFRFAATSYVQSKQLNENCLGLESLCTLTDPSKTMMMRTAVLPISCYKMQCPSLKMFQLPLQDYCCRGYDDLSSKSPFKSQLVLEGKVP
jgi:hypothetical protein